MSTNLLKDSRLPAVLYFAILAFLLVIFSRYTLLSLQQNTVLPLLPSLILGSSLGAFLGYLFAPILKIELKFAKAFLMGLVIGLLALIFVSLSVLIAYYFDKSNFVLNLTGPTDYLIFITTVFFSLLVTLGVWLLPLSGFATVYFNRRFLPGLIKAANSNKG